MCVGLAIEIINYTIFLGVGYNGNLKDDKLKLLEFVFYVDRWVHRLG